jgi:hypothetical protein
MKNDFNLGVSCFLKAAVGTCPAFGPKTDEQPNQKAV